MTSPTIPDEADQDIPLGQPAGKRQSTGEARGKRKLVTDPEAKHRRDMDKSKLRFAIWLVTASLGVLVVLELIEQFSVGTEGQTLAGAIDTLKLIATTALGFVFGRTLGRGDS
ncbi:hypothetical protein [Clavibacter tessellarius]|uniref:hypothetical protein n=1 Tax=Clavibacter tessellarius TaxID=31965 RepID=UPI0039E786B7